MKTSSPFTPQRFLAFALAMGITALVAADTKFITPPRVERVVEKDAPVYMIVEDPASPEGTTQVIEILPATPSPATRKSRSRSAERGETLYLEEIVVPKVIPVDPPSRPSSSSKKKTTIASSSSSSKSKSTTASSKSNGSSSRKTATVQKPDTSNPPSEDAQREVQMLKERVDKLQGELDLARRKTPDRTEVFTATKSESRPSAPIFTATEERLPVVTSPPPVEVTQTTVRETSTPNDRTADRPPISPSKVEPPLPQASEEPIETAPPRPIESAKKDAPPPSSTPDPEDEDAPMAKKSDKPGLVTSPYPPHRLIDVRGLTPGTLAKDPSTNEVFRVP